MFDILQDLSSRLQSLPAWYREAAVVAVEVAAVLFGSLILRLLLRLIFRGVERAATQEKSRALVVTVRRNLSGLLTLVVVVLLLSIAGLNGYLIYQGQEIFGTTSAWVSRIPPEFWPQLGLGLAKVVGLMIVATIAIRVLRRMLNGLQNRAKTLDRITANDESIEVFFQSLNRIQTNSVWLLVFGFTALWLRFPAGYASTVFIAFRVYLIIAIGLLVVKGVAAIVDSLDTLSARFASPDNLLRFYHNIRTLVPLFRRCLEYVIYVCVATLVTLQVDFIAPFATYGPRLIQIIGIFFLSRVAIEICHLLVDTAQSRQTGLSQVEQQQRATLIPLVKSFLRAVIYFAALALVLSVINFNPLPLLAGAGIVGVVVGLGAQSVINDLVSGFFVLSENLYLVGDYIEVGSARGTVESIQLRTTRLRDPNGAQHIVRNGQLSGVVNYSKSYTFAVVEVGVVYGSNLDHVYEVLRQLGQEFKASHPSVIEPTEVRGLEKFGDNELLIRTTTRVQPGTHGQVARDLRKLIKEVFEREGIELRQPKKA